MDGRHREGTNLVEEVSSGRLGERVRELRRRRGLTLDALAARSGVSRAMISKLERGEKNPTLVVAARVAEGLGVDLMQLAGIEKRGRVVVVPRQAATVARDPQTGFERRLLSQGFGEPRIEFTRNIVPEGSSTGDITPRRRGTEGYVVVGSGTLRAVIGGEAYLLETGDALYFDADVAHRFDNAGEGGCCYYAVFDGGDR